MKKEPKCSVCPDDVKSIPKNLKKYQKGTRTFSDPKQYEEAAGKYRDSLDLYTHNNYRLQNLLKLNKSIGAINKLEYSSSIPKDVYESANTMLIAGSKKYKKLGEDFESLEHPDIDPIDSWKLTELYDKYKAPAFIKEMGLFDSKEEGFVDYGLVYKKPVQLPIFKKAEEKKQQPAVKPTPPVTQEKKVEVVNPRVVVKKLDTKGNIVEQDTVSPTSVNKRFDSATKTWKQKLQLGGDLKKYQVGTNFLKESASPPKIPKELQRFDVKPKGTSGVIKKDIGPEATYHKVVDGVKARFNDKTPDSLSENLLEFVDPSGILSHDDAGKAYSKWGKENSFLPTGEEALDMFGAVPMLGKFSKLKYLVEGKGLMKSAYKYFPWQKAVNTADGSQDVYSDNLKVEGTESSVKRRKTIEENTSKFKTPLSKYQLGTSTYVAPPMPLNLKKMVEEDELAKRISSNEAAAVKMAPLAYKGPVPKLDKVDYRHTNIQSKNYSGNPNLAFTAPGKTGETRKLMEENFNAGTMAALEFATPLAATKITKPLTNLLKAQDQYLDVQNLSRLRTELADKGILKSQKTPNFPWKEPIRKGIDPWGYNIAEKIQDVGSLFKNSKNRHYLSPEQMEIAYQEELKYLAQVNPNSTYSRADFMSSLPQENFFKTTRENVLDRFNNRFKSYSQIAKNRAASWDMYLGKPQLENPMYDVSELSTKKNTVYTIKPEYIDLPTVENSLNSHIDLIQNQYPKMSPEKTFRILDSDSDYFGTMGGFNWDISKIKGGHYKAIANDKWDLHPFDYGLSDFAPYRKIYNNAGNFGRKVLDGAEKKLKGIEAGKALGIGKPMDVKVGFILDGKTKKIIKTFGAAPLAASNEETNKGDGKGNLPKLQLGGAPPDKKLEKNIIPTASDSLMIYNSALLKEKFYDKNKDYYTMLTDKGNKKNISRLIEDVKKNKDVLNEGAAIRNKENPLIGSREPRFNIHENMVELGDIFIGDLPDTYYNKKAPSILLHPNINPDRWDTYGSSSVGDVSRIPIYNKNKVYPKSMGEAPHIKNPNYVPDSIFTGTDRGPQKVEQAPVTVPSSITAPSPTVKKDIERLMMPSGSYMQKEDFIKKYGESAWRKASGQNQLPKRQLGGELPKFQLAGPTDGFKDTTLNQSSGAAKNSYSSNLNDFYISSEEYEKNIKFYNEREKECHSGGCLEQAQIYYDKYVSPRLGTPNSWQIKENAGIGSGPSHARKKDYGESADSWDIHGLLQEKGARKIYSNEATDKNPRAELTNEEWRALNIPIGSIVGMGSMGGAGGKYENVSYNAKKNLPTSNHSSMVVGYNEEGIPMTYDYGQLVPITKRAFSFPVTNITAPKETQQYTYEYLKEKGLLRDDYNDLSIKTASGTKYDEDEYLPFTDALSKNKQKFANAFNLSSNEYDELAKRAAATALTETGGGDDTTVRWKGVIPVPSYITDKIGIGDTTGITQVNEEMIFKHEGISKRLESLGITKKNYDPWNPEHVSAATMALLKDNLAAQKSNIKIPGNSKNLSDAAAGYYQWVQPSLMRKGEAWGESEKVKKFMENYLKISTHQNNAKN